MVSRQNEVIALPGSYQVKIILDKGTERLARDATPKSPQVRTPAFDTREPYIDEELLQGLSAEPAPQEPTSVPAQTVPELSSPPSRVLQRGKRPSAAEGLRVRLPPRSPRKSSEN